jgi:hypothetical protein
VAGCATPTSSAGHPDGRVSAVHELTLLSDHSMGAGHLAERPLQGGLVFSTVIFVG